jgi:hypothetical protein
VILFYGDEIVCDQCPEIIKVFKKIAYKYYGVGHLSFGNRIII